MKIFKKEKKLQCNKFECKFQFLILTTKFRSGEFVGGGTSKFMMENFLVIKIGLLS
jgi:hypothetical protein